MFLRKILVSPAVRSAATRSFGTQRLSAAQVKTQLQAVKEKMNRASLAHGSNAEAMIKSFTEEPIVVDAHVAVCDGGGGALGHPLEFIQLNRVNPKTPEICTYCGLQFVEGHAHH